MAHDYQERKTRGGNWIIVSGESRRILHLARIQYLRTAPELKNEEIW